MKQKLLYIVLIISFLISNRSFGQLSTGDIAFVGFNADGGDDFAIVALADIPANTVIYFSDNEPSGATSINTGEGFISWDSGGSIISAGNVITFTDVLTASLSSDLGTLTDGSGSLNLAAGGDALFAYHGSNETTPSTWLAGIQNESGNEGAFLALTGLSAGSNTFITFTPSGNPDGGEYNGARTGETSFFDYLALIANPTNWSRQGSNGELILPIDNTVFTISAGTPCATPTAQTTSLDLTSNTTLTSIDGTFTAASPTADNYLIVISTNTSLSSNPVDTSSYIAGNSLGGGTVVQVGNSTSFTASSLSPGTLYYFFVFSYNDVGCSGGPLYYTTSPLSGNETTLSGPCIDENFDSFTGGAPSGWTGSGASNYTSTSSSGLSPNSVSFNSTNDYLETPTVTNPSSLSFWIKGNGTDASSALLVEGWDGSSYTTIENISPLPTTQTTKTYTTGLSSYTNFRFTYTKSSGNLAFDDVVVNCNPICSITATNFSPSSGPIGTTVSVTGTGFTGSTTATINGVSAEVNFVSATEIEVRIPAGATTSDLEITEAGCAITTTSFTVLEDASTCVVSEFVVPAGWTDLLISGLFDNDGGSCHYIELYNPTASDITLTGAYSLGLDSNSLTENGAFTTDFSINLSGTVTALSTFMIRIKTPSDTCNDCSSLTLDQEEFHFSFGVNGNIHNGNYRPDRIALINSSTITDLWVNSESAIPGYIYTRDDSSVAPNTTYTNTDWDFNQTPNCFGFTLELVNIAPYILTHPYDPPPCSTDAVLSVVGYDPAYDPTDVAEKPLAYQWYIAAPGDTNWTTLSDGGLYSGSETDTLTISNTATLDDYQYYCRVSKDDPTCYRASEAVKIDTALTTINWNGTWSNGIGPTSAVNVTLNSDYDTTVNGDFSCCNLILSDDVVLDINGTDDFVSVQNDLTVNNNGILNVENNSSLVMVYDYGDVTLTGTGIINVNKQSTPYELYDYTYWSSPIVDETIEDALTGSYANYIFYYNGANYNDVDGDGFDDDGDDWVQVGATHQMDPGKGYAAMGNIAAGSYPHTQNATFSGEVNNGIITEAVVVNSSPSASSFDYNLVGNPYPSAIYADELILQNPAISGTLYFWTHIDDISSSYPGPDAQNFHPDDYASYNLTGGVATALGSTSDAGASNAPTGMIGSGQGFIVEANFSGDLRFNNSMRDITHSNSQFFRSSVPSNLAPVKDRMWINLTNPQGAFNQTLIGFFDNATHGYDSYYDGVFLGGGTHVSFYSLINGNAFNIQGKPTFKDTYEIPLGFDSRILVPLTISIHETEGILSDIPIYLIDNELDIVHDLKEGDYTFEISEIGTYNNRFEIVFQEPSALNIDEVEGNNSNLIITNQSKNILVKYIDDNINTISHIKAYDVLGRLLIDASPNENELNITSNSIRVGTVLFFKVQLSNGEILKQNFIKL